jgi:succinate dehydrogenase/fumarate reductase flavoprotein subunit
VLTCGGGDLIHIGLTRHCTTESSADRTVNAALDAKRTHPSLFSNDLRNFSASICSDAIILKFCGRVIRDVVETRHLALPNSRRVIGPVGRVIAHHR